MLCTGVNIFLILSFPLVGNLVASLREESLRPSERFWTSQNDGFDTSQLAAG